MGPGTTYFAVTFLSGALLLVGWLYATAANARSGAILRKSLLFFALPIVFVPAGLLLKLPLGMWLLVAWEEGLKAFASSRERDRFDKFWLVALFGIWELTLDKPWYGLMGGWANDGWDRLSLAGLVYATALPVLMHATTASIYAFTFERRLWAAFGASWALHAAFNESIDYFGFSPLVVAGQTAVLGAILALVLMTVRRARAVDQG